MTKTYAPVLTFDRTIYDYMKYDARRVVSAFQFCNFSCNFSFEVSWKVFCSFGKHIGKVQSIRIRLWENCLLKIWILFCVCRKLYSIHNFMTQLRHNRYTYTYTSAIALNYSLYNILRKAFNVTSNKLTIVIPTIYL